MFSYFIPISLMVLASFTLGLVVGRLAWSSAKAAASSKPDDSKEPDTAANPPASDTAFEDGDPTQDPGSFISSAPTNGAPDELPTWRMGEVRPLEPQAAEENEPSVIEPDADPEPEPPLETADGIDPGADPTEADIVGPVRPPG